MFICQVKKSGKRSPTKSQAVTYEYINKNEVSAKYLKTNVVNNKIIEDR